jgi:hypothetical protein
MSEHPVTTTAEENVRAWLERQADFYMDYGEFTSDVPLDVTGAGVRADMDAGSVREGDLFRRSEVRELVFYAYWHDAELTTIRRRPPRR